MLIVSGLYADDEVLAPSTEEVGKALTVIMDCISASLVTECTDSPISLSCSNVQMDHETNLPRRIAYFLADPAEYVSALTPKSDSSGFFAAFFALLSNTVEDPLVSAVYLAMSTRGYHQGGYLLSGSISFTYPDGATLDDVLEIWSTRYGTKEGIMMAVDMQLYGSELTRPLVINGNFRMGLSDLGDIVVNAVDIYTINGIGYIGGEFRF
ncbi:MAG: hypothetical protein MJ057_00740 [Sphaerochaetaceae bacterium]|nr:hypothetical protein [Sphaerochaetaceae bacterium]